MGFTGKDDRPPPWEVTDAPAPYVDLLRRNIIGIEIAIDRLEGKFKMSQELSQGDRDGVIKAFEALGSEVGSRLAAVVKERQELKASREK